MTRSHRSRRRRLPLAAVVLVAAAAGVLAAILLERSHDRPGRVVTSRVAAPAHTAARAEGTPASANRLAEHELPALAARKLLPKRRRCHGAQIDERETEVAAD